jgi:hypothetical protein
MSPCVRYYYIFNPFPHCTFDVAHLTAELQISPPQKDDIMQNEDDSDDVTGADL